MTPTMPPPVHLVFPAVYVQHHPFLRRVVDVERLNDRLYVRWRFPWKPRP